MGDYKLSGLFRALRTGYKNSFGKLNKRNAVYFADYRLSAPYFTILSLCLLSPFVSHLVLPANALTNTNIAAEQTSASNKEATQGPLYLSAPATAQIDPVTLPISNQDTGTSNTERATTLLDNTVSQRTSGTLIKPSLKTARSVQSFEENQTRLAQDNTPEDLGRIPVDAVPPYTDDLSALKPKPVFNISDNLSWIIAIIGFILFAVCFGWAIKWLISNALRVDEHESEDIFQINEDGYRFDEGDEPSTVNLAHASNGHDHAINSLNDLDPDFTDDDDMVTQEKAGFMARLLRRGKKKDLYLDDQGQLDEDYDDEQKAHIIDTEVEMITHDNDHEFGHSEYNQNIDVIETEPEMPPHHSQPAHPESNQTSELPETMAFQPSDHHQKSEAEVEFSIDEDAPEIDEEAEMEEIKRQEENHFFIDNDLLPESTAASSLLQPRADTVRVADNERKTMNTSEVIGFSTQIQQEDYQTNPQPLSLHAQEQIASLNEAVTNLETRQANVSNDINTIEQKMVMHAQSVQNDLTSIQDQLSTHQQNVDQTLESRFSVISNNIEQGMAYTRQATDEKLSEIETMNTQELEEKILKLDEQIAVQNRTNDLHFTNLIRKIDALPSSNNELAKLRGETENLKSQIQYLAQKTITQTAPQDNTILNKLDASMSKQHQTLKNWQAENQHMAERMASTIDHLNDRINRIEEDLKGQQALFAKLLDDNQNAKPQEKSEPAKPVKETRLDPLGLITPALSRTDTHDTKATPEPSSSTHLGSRSVYEPAYTNGHDKTPAPLMEESEPTIEGPEITPILIDGHNLVQNTAPSTDKATNKLTPAHNHESSIITTKPQQEEKEEKKADPLIFNFSNSYKGDQDR